MQYIAAILLICQCPDAEAATPANVYIVGPSRVGPSNFARLTVRVGAPGLSVDELRGPPTEDAFVDVQYCWMLIDSDKVFFDHHRRGRGPELTFVTGDEGKYTFLFVCHLNGQLLVAKHVLQVGAAPTPQPDPPGPSPEPEPSRFGLTAKARQWAQGIQAPARSEGVNFAIRLDAIADPILDGQATRLPQELLNEMMSAAKDLSPPWREFRANLQAFLQKLIDDGKLATSRDVAAMLKELSAGVK